MILCNGKKKEKKPLKRYFVKVSLFHDHMWKTRLDMKREKCLEWPGMLHKKSTDGHFVSDKVAVWAFVH
jgi:hypothetical protein